MKLRIIFISLFICSAFFAVSAQDKKKSKKQKKSQPDLAVVHVQETPLAVPVAPPQKPANGSLFTDNTVNGNLLRDFKARQIGDLVFVDVVESTTATVA